MSVVDGLRRLLKPRHIAVAGGRLASVIIRECDRIGYAGPIWPIHPDKTEIAGHKAYRTVADLPEAPDAVFVATPREPTVDIVAALAERGAGAAVCYAAGFAEVGEEGAALQKKLVELAKGMPIVGPNCYGVLNLLDGCVLWPDTHGAERVEKGVAIITQSGNIALNMTMQRRALPIAYVIAVGNKAIGDHGDYIEALLADERVTAIGLHVESIDDVALFSQAAIKALEKGVPLVVLKTGRSEIGSEIAMSHTSSLAGADALYNALFARYGVARVVDVPAFVETLKLMHLFGGLPGKRISSMSCSGGEAALIADLAADRDLEFAPIPPENAARLQELLTDKVHVSNPLDYHTYIWGNEPANEAVFTEMLNSGFDLNLLVLDQPRTDRGLVPDGGFAAARAAITRAAAASGARAAVVSSLPENMQEDDAKALLADGVLPMQGMGDALTAITHGVDFTMARAGWEKLVPLRKVARIDVGKARLLSEYESKHLLGRHGLELPPSRIAGTVEAPSTAAALGFPVAIKIHSDKIAHKSDVGGVKLGLRSRADVTDAVASMSHLGDRFLVERMVEGAVAELIVGVVRDPQFGPTLTVGAGGVLVEMLKDAAVMLLPVTAEEIREKLMSLRVARLLEGFRGKPRGDIRGTIKAILAIADFAERHADRLVELDVNPLFVLPEGRGAIAADALVRMLD
ncbi:acetate--CoA ligase family protein [Labrys portucalensis]|uniref:Acetate--CoA ligase family protein n=1 Tax=Labrys neptuniae TaxID=376174 RepID=A0ABV6ZIF7_9HYPH|nr:acetate--CoA ligase family protein [Labrys neptuniae]MDT3378847.1 acetate--CoA ligase family protein [Labrys neptuniae]